MTEVKIYLQPHSRNGKMVKVRHKFKNGKFVSVYKDRKCTRCGSAKSGGLTKYGTQMWQPFEGKLYCNRCYGFIYYHDKHPEAKAHLKTPKVCSECGSKKTHINKKGCPMWYNVGGKRHCSKCWNRIVQYPKLKAKKENMAHG